MEKENTNRIEEIQTIDLEEINDIKELHEKFAAILQFPKSYGHNWKAFWSAITETEKLPLTLILYNFASLATRFSEDTKILSDMIWDYDRLGRDPAIFFDHINKSDINAKLSPIEQIFATEPRQYGYRGDPYLWNDLNIYFGSRPIPVNEIELLRQIHEAIEVLTGNTIEKEKDFFVEKYRASGMSGGFVNSDFWLKKGIPRLIARYRKLKPTW